MDWLEQLFGLNPDGGDGSIEALIVVAVVVIVLAIAFTVSERLRAIGISAVARLTRRSKTVR